MSRKIVFSKKAPTPYSDYEAKESDAEGYDPSNPYAGASWAREVEREQPRTSEADLAEILRDYRRLKEQEERNRPSPRRTYTYRSEDFPRLRGESRRREDDISSPRYGGQPRSARSSPIRHGQKLSSRVHYREENRLPSRPGTPTNVRYNPTSSSTRPLNLRRPISPLRENRRRRSASGERRQERSKKKTSGSPRGSGKSSRRPSASPRPQGPKSSTPAESRRVVEVTPPPAVPQPGTTKKEKKPETSTPVPPLPLMVERAASISFSGSERAASTSLESGTTPRAAEDEEIECLTPMQLTKKNRVVRYNVGENCDLQNYIVNTPKGHPTKTELLTSLKINCGKQVDDLYYCRVAPDEIVVGGVNLHHSSRLRDSGKQPLHASSPWHPRSDFEDRMETQRISRHMHTTIRRNLLLTQDKSITEGEHLANRGCCMCPPTVMGTQFPQQPPLVCDKRKYLKKNFAKPGLRVEDKTLQPNPSYHFIFSEATGKRQLAVPQHFLFSGSHNGIIYQPAMAMEKCEVKNDLFYSLFNEQNSAEVYEAYMKDPREWQISDHPQWSEPTEDQELWQWSRGLYGAETLHRILPAAHPARLQEICLYSLTNRVSYLVPCLTGPHRPGAMEISLGRLLRPFIKKGYGQIMCPICLFEIRDKVAIPLFFSRSAFLNHYEDKHHKDVGIVGLHFPTQLGSRQLEAHVIYSMCCVDGEMLDRPEAEAANFEAKLPSSWGTTTHLKKFMDRNAPHRLAAERNEEAAQAQQRLLLAHLQQLQEEEPRQPEAPRASRAPSRAEERGPEATPVEAEPLAPSARPRLEAEPADEIPRPSSSSSSAREAAESARPSSSTGQVSTASIEDEVMRF